jgi:hypothetical protein
MLLVDPVLSATELSLLSLLLDKLDNLLLLFIVVRNHIRAKHTGERESR